MFLPPTDLIALQELHSEVVEEFLHPDNLRVNVVGLGVGIKWRNKQPTGTPALMALVTHKVAKHKLSKISLLPSILKGIDLVVISVGRCTTKADNLLVPNGISSLTNTSVPYKVVIV